MGFFSDIFGGGDKTVTSSPQMPAWTWPLLEGQGSLPNTIMDTFNNAPQAQYYPGQTVAPLTANQKQGGQMLVNQAKGLNSFSKNVRNQFNQLTKTPFGDSIAPGMRENLMGLMATGGTDVNALQQNLSGIASGNQQSPGMANLQQGGQQMPAMQQLLSGGLSPYHQSVLQGGVNDLMRNFGNVSDDIYTGAERNLFNRNSDSLLSGNFGGLGSGAGIGEQLTAQEFARAQGRATEALGENASQLYGDVLNSQFNSARTAQLGALGQSLQAQGQGVGMDLDARLSALNQQGALRGQELNARLGAGSTAASLYGQERGQAGNVFGQAGNVANLSLLPGQVIAGVGDAQQAQQQAHLNADQQRWNFNNQQAPWMNTQNLYNMLGPMISGAPAGTTSTQQGGSAFGNMLGMGLGAAGIAGGLGWQPFAPGGGAGLFPGQPTSPLSGGQVGGLFGGSNIFR